MSHDETTARLEMRALERMVRALCEHAERLSREMRNGADACRESDFQLQAFDERRAQAMRVLDAPPSEPTETRIARLEKLVEALDCSRDYFRPSRVTAGHSEWSIRLP